MPVPMVGEQTVLQYLLNSDTRHLKVKLAKNPLPADLAVLVLADLTEADFDGYAAIVDPVFSPVTLNEQGYAEGICGPLIWTAGPAIVPQQITGIYITVADGLNPEGLVWINRLSPPLTMSAPGQTFGKKIRLMVADRAT